MRAVGYRRSLPIDAPEALVDVELPDPVAAGRDLLAEVSRLVDGGTLRTPLAETMGPIRAENLRKAHALIESGRSRGKVVLAGF